MTDFIFFGGKAIGNYVLRHLMQDGFIPKAIVCYRDHLDADLLNIAQTKGVNVMVIHTLE